ncbi:MAG TPA: hypothetical protein VLA43_06530, partial [Longimicrobiales bacterium]|nr:hypothetical protein [Longimicrobiales bacterium]
MPPLSTRSRCVAARVAGLVSLLVLLPALAVRAQEAPDSANAPRWWAGIDILAGDPLGPFGDRVDDAWGFQLRLRHTRNPLGPWAFHLDLGLMGYGDEYR